MIAGGILGALGGAALACGYRLVGSREQPRVTWAPPFLDQLTRQVVLRYLAVAHFGRGRGPYRDLERPARWTESVERALTARSRDLGKIWQRAQDPRGDDGGGDHPRHDLIAILNGVTREVLLEAYPHAAKALS